MGVYKRGKTWYIDYYDQYGKRHREAVGRNKRQAEQALAKRKTEVAEGKFLDKKKQKKIKFKDFANEFIEFHSKPNKKSWKRDVQLVNHLKNFFGEKKLYEITPLDIEKYKKNRIQKVKPATVNREIACLKAIFNKAIQWGKATENPMDKVKLYKENNQIVRYLTEKEMVKLIENSTGYLKPIVIIALNTGMRLNEIINLQWKDIAFEQKIINIIDSKNGEKREIPVNDIVINVLKDWKNRSEGSFVFTKGGKPISKRSVQSRFKTALKRAGIRNFRFHDLRHTFASHLVMNGTDLKTVQELLGHKTFDMTLRYAHLSPDHKRLAIDNFGHKMQKVVTIWSQSENSLKRENLNA